MPDLTIEPIEQCMRVRCESKEWSKQGGCWPWKKSAKGFEHGQCKHMCGWHQLVGPETQDANERDHHACPRCGGRTETVMVGV